MVFASSQFATSSFLVSIGGFLRARLVLWSCVPLWVDHHPFVSFWELGPQGLESCRTNPFFRERNFTLLIPIRQAARNDLCHCRLGCSPLKHHSWMDPRHIVRAGELCTTLCLLSRHSSNRSACGPRRYRCFFASAS